MARPQTWRLIDAQFACLPVLWAVICDQQAGVRRQEICTTDNGECPSTALFLCI